MLHDGGTLTSHQKYQAIGMQFVGADWAQNFTICFGLVACADGHDVHVADVIRAHL